MANLASSLPESMFIAAATTPFRAIGTAVEGAVSAAQVLEASGMDHTVETRALVTADGLASDHRLVVRSDGRSLCTVGPDWTPVQDRSAFAMFDSLVADGLIAYDCAGTMRGGVDTWISAKLLGDAGRVSGDDTIERYLLFTNSHGRASVRIGFTGIRCVCANMTSMILGSKSSAIVSTPHTRHVNTRIEQVYGQIRRAIASSDKTIERYREMQAIPVKSRTAVDRYLVAVFGAEEQKRQETAKLKNGGRSKLAESIEQLQTSGRGSDLAGSRGTAWGLYNAVTEYLTHCSGRSKDPRRRAETRLESNLFGTQARFASLASSNEALETLTIGTAPPASARVIECVERDSVFQVLGV